MKLRISNGHSHAEEFTATSLSSFVLGAGQAITRFTQWRVSQYQHWQTRKIRAETARDPRLEVHVLHNGEWVFARCTLNARTLFTHSQTAWNAVNDSFRNINRVEAGLRGLSAWIAQCDKKPRQLHIVK